MRCDPLEITTGHCNSAFFLFIQGMPNRNENRRHASVHREVVSTLPGNVPSNGKATPKRSCSCEAFANSLAHASSASSFASEQAMRQKKEDRICEKEAVRAKWPIKSRASGTFSKCGRNTLTLAMQGASFAEFSDELHLHTEVGERQHTCFRVKGDVLRPFGGLHSPRRGIVRKKCPVAVHRSIP